jgi:hypothetical protein
MEDLDRKLVLVLNLAAFVFVFTLAIIRFFQTRLAYSYTATHTCIVRYIAGPVFAFRQ